MTEVSNGEAAAGEAMVAPQQTEECSGATATQLQHLSIRISFGKVK